MQLASLRRTAVITLTAAALAGSSACFGSFNMTRKLYGFNKKVSDEKFVRELVFLGLNIVPVYWVASAIDVVVANSVEFWTGENPIKMTSTMKLDANTRVVTSFRDKDGVRVMSMETFTLDKLVSTTSVLYAPGSTHMTFKTVFTDGRSEAHVSAIGDDGKAFVTSGTYADVLKASAKQ